MMKQPHSSTLLSTRKPKLSTSLGLLSLSILASAMSIAHAETYVVDRYQDDNRQGSLRWAIEQSNANPAAEGSNEIHIQAVGSAPYTITLNEALPAIKAPVKIVGTQWAKTGEFIAVDGSGYIEGEGEKACPGANPVQYGTNVRTMTLPGFVLQDVDGVTITGLDVHRFCIGVLINRSSNNLIQHNRISNNYGGSGVMLTGDDGQGNPTSTTTNNNKVLNNLFIDNGDGLELTRGAAFNLIANNTFTSTDTNPEPSQGIEILWGNDNAVVGNTFSNYSDGLQINWGARNYIAYNEMLNNSIGFNLTGNGNILDSNRIHDNRIGVAIRSEKDPNARITLTKNQIWDNGKDIRRCEAGGSCVPNQVLGAIVFGVPALEHDGFVGSRGGGVVIEPQNLQKTCTESNTANCNAIPNQNIQPPVLNAVSAGRVMVGVQGKPNQRYHVELFGNSSADGSEAEHYLASTVVTTNDNGTGAAQFNDISGSPASVTATVTDELGATSELSNPIALR